MLVLWADDRSTNLGVRALAAGTAELAQRSWPGAEVVHLYYGSAVSPMPLGSWRRLVQARFDPRLPLRDWLADFDVAIDTRGGDSFADIYGRGRLLSQSLVAQLAVGAGTPVVLGPQTVGPFDSRRGRAMARWTLRHSAAVIARDAVSAQYAQRLGRPVDLLATDVVFALPRPAVERTRDVLLNVSGLLWTPNPHVDHLRYRETVLDLSRKLVASGRHVSLLAHVLDAAGPDNDVPAVREAATLLDDPDVAVLVPDDLTHVRELTASAQLVIGSRMHACLNALSTGTPAVPLAYSRKFAPLLADLGWAHTVDLRSSSAPVDEVLDVAQRPLSDDVAGVLHRADELLEPVTATLQAAGAPR
ncbi:hypothetical protein CCO02nite_16240 [Cellulomonas composti]|uniref:Polysaccharide pyruvyl transferase domain-containing protein n=1 Tax=Cellulomonas composti TaxID=266130 RepID=A0A511JAF2_9CELL|nr:hypothetical protein CCO02nite_16240 [Cellulomonas composti]